MRAVPRPLRVLIADTDCPGVACLADRLKFWGHEAHAAADGGAALAALRLTLPDVLLLGLDLPGLDALTVLMTLRRERACPPILVVALTTEVLGPTRLTSVLAGADYILGKPIDPLRLRDILTRRQQFLFCPPARTRTGSAWPTNPEGAAHARHPEQAQRAVRHGPLVRQRQ